MDRDNLNVLVIAPHHDDEVIGCGGLISLLVSKGYNVSVVHVFNGSSGVAERSSKVSQKVRHVEAVAASKIAGFTLIPNLNFDDRLPVNTSDI
ncbi:MAG: PIG-L family deacetylase, partial [Candidatus Shapirobacteria bacterium]|nr:PIG-L family deacetylase [Candidatus Shapirobacteria bacterium]